MAIAYICEGVRTPIGRYAGVLAQVRTDDLAAHPLTELRLKFENSDWETLDEVILGCVNQAGEDNRNVARMATLIAGIPETVPAVTVNRLCASGMEAIAVAASGIAAGEFNLAIAGGVERHESFALCHAKSKFGLFAQCGSLRHYPRVAIYQSHHRQTLWHRFNGANRRKRRRSVQNRSLLAR